MGGNVDVELVSALELPAAVVARVSEAVGKSVGKKADVKVSVDADLIGGMTLRIGDTLIDGSVATQLAKVEAQLKRGGVSRLQGDLSGVLG
jgi:ATP synthase F1 delta subunit